MNLANAAGTFDISGTTAGATITTLNGVANSNVTLGSQTLTIANGSTTYAGIIGGTGGLSLTAGTETLSGTNTYTGATTINGGTLALSGTGSIAASNQVNLANAAGTFDISGTTAGATITTLNGVANSNVTLGAQTLTIANGSTTYAGIIGGTGGLTLTAGTETLSGTNTYTGATTINGGTLALSGTGSIAASSQVNLANAAGTFDISGTTAGATITTLNGVANSNVTLGSQTLTIANGSTTYAGIIGGTGGLTLTAGTETLSGTNTYTGVTTINGGTLTLSGTGSIAASSQVNLANAAGTFSIAGTTAGATITTLNGVANSNVTLGAQTLIIANGSTTYAGIVGGTGGLTLTAGTETLSGTNTYTGATTINGGTLALSGTGSIAASSQVNLANAAGTFDISGTTAGATITTLNGVANSNVTLGSQTLTIANGSTTYAGIIGGTGGLTLTAGTETLSGTNTYTGVTTINGGTLALSGTGSIAASSQVNLANAAGTFDISGTTAGATIKTLNGVANSNVTLGAQTLTIANGSTTYAGIVGGTGGLTLTAGTETLSGTNTYTGATTINGGTLAAGAINAFSAASAFTVASGAFLDLGGFNQAIGSLAGAGTVTDNGAPATLTTGANNTSTIFSGVIQDGTGVLSLTKSGTGTLTLSGTNTYTGATTINGGTLEVDGSIASPKVTVNSGGTLSGIGTVDPTTTTIMSGGTLAPGNAANPTGVLSIVGNLAFQSGALYVVQVTPSGASSANVSGTATLSGGTVNARFTSGSYLAKQYSILTAAAGLGGTTFASLANTNLPVGFTDNLSYSGNAVFLNLTAALGALSTGGLNTNQQNVANALNNFFNSGGTLPPNFVGVFGLTGSNLANALTQLDGEAATGAERAVFQLTNEFLDLMLDPFVNGRGNAGLGGSAIGFAPNQDASLPRDIALAYSSILNKAPPKPTFDQRWTAWGAAYGGGNSANGNTLVGSSNVTAQTYGFAGGMDYHFSPDTLAGFALAGAGTNWGLANALGGGRSDAFQAGAYGISWFGPAYIAGALAFTNHWFTTNRTALNDQLTANFVGQSYGARLEGGYRTMVLPALGVTPYAALQAQDFYTPAYSETDVTGGGFGLNYATMNATDVRSELGARFDDPTLLYGKPLILFGRAAWAHDWVSNPALGAIFQSLPGASFTVNGAPIPQNSALTSVGAELWLSSNLSVIAKFDGELASGSHTYAGSGTLRYRW